MKMYDVCYKLYGADLEKETQVIAKTKADAYEIAAFEKIPEIEGEHPYSVWVKGYTTQKGDYHRFNTCEGMAY